MESQILNSLHGNRRGIQRFALAVVITLSLSGCVATNDLFETRGTAPVSGSLMNAGDALVAEGDYSGAVALYRSAHDAHPDEAEPLIRMGRALASAGANADAAEAFRAALDRDADSAAAKRGLGNALIGLGQPGLAIAHLQDAVRLSEAANGVADWRANLSLGVARDLSGDPIAAQDSYRQGLSTAPENPDLINNLGLSLSLSGQAEAAVSMLEALVADHGDRGRYAGTLAIAYALSGREAEAARLMALESPPDTVARNLTSLAVIRTMDDHARKALAIQTVYSG